MHVFSSDAIGSLATLAGQPGFCRPTIVDCPPNKKPGIKVIQGRHPCVEVTHTGGSFIPNDLTLGCHVDADDSGSSNEASILLLSGPNMVRLRNVMDLILAQNTEWFLCSLLF